MFSVSFEPRRGPDPIAYQVADDRVLCAPGCLTHAEAQAIVDSGRRAGDVHRWTVDLYPGDADLRCDGCRRVLVQAPPDDEPNDEEELKEGTQL
ncbi:hypothetical protein [Microtetraspora malaysiensis]|uniref:Uncharacterized protein n=1 Tax=Microtetraspora malaysiensis TaxID=161358 RepID=A0ABW6SKD3_9ACTN